MPAVLRHVQTVHETPDPFKGLIVNTGRNRCHDVRIRPVAEAEPHHGVTFSQFIECNQKFVGTLVHTDLHILHGVEVDSLGEHTEGLLPVDPCDYAAVASQRQRDLPFRVALDVKLRIDRYLRGIEPEVGEVDHARTVRKPDVVKTDARRVAGPEEVSAVQELPLDLGHLVVVVQIAHGGHPGTVVGHVELYHRSVERNLGYSRGHP